MTAAVLAALPSFASVFAVIDGVVVVNNPGLLDPIRSSVHHQGRPCVHLDTPKPPVLLLLGWDAVAALNFQSRLVATPAPVHASRVADRLTIGVDTLSGRCCTSRGKDELARPLQHSWVYQLRRLQWAGEQDPCPGIVAALREDHHHD